MESSNGNCVVDNGSIIMVTATTGNNGGCNVIKPMPEPPSQNPQSWSVNGMVYHWFYDISQP